MHFLCNPDVEEYILCRIRLRRENPFDIQKNSNFQPFEGCPHKHETIHPFFFKVCFFVFSLFGCCAVAISMYSYIVDHPFCWFVSFDQSLWCVGSVLSNASILAHDASHDSSVFFDAEPQSGGKAKSQSCESLWN